MADDSLVISNNAGSDNPDYTPATDEVGGVHYQKVKLIDPTPDSTAPIGVSANPMHVQGTVTPSNSIPISNASSLSGFGAILLASYPVTTDAAETGSTTSTINATSHVARVRDLIEFVTGNNARIWAQVSAVTANTISLTHALPVSPSNGDVFFILRPRPPYCTHGINGAVGLEVSLNRNSQSNDNTFLLKRDNTAFTGSDVGVAVFARRKDTASNSADADGKYGMLNTDPNGKLWTNAEITVALPAGTNAIGKLAANSGVDIGDVDVTSISAGSNLIGDIALQPRASATGWDIRFNISMTSSNYTVKGSAGKLGGWDLNNNTAAICYFKFYNLTSVNPASDVPTFVIPVPAGSAKNIEFTAGIAFSTGMIVRCVTGVGNTSTASPAANTCIGTFLYK